MELLIDPLTTSLLDFGYSFFDANKRIYWLYLFSTLVLSLLVLLNRLVRDQRIDRVNALKRALSTLCNRKIWCHQSAKTDYKLMLINVLIKGIYIPPLLFASLPISLFIYDILSVFSGPARLVSHSDLTLLYFTLLLFILDDASRFVLHYALHKVSWLWVFHQVHHSAEVMTPLTIYRTHPIESALYGARMVLVNGVSAGIGLCFFGPGLSMLDFLGANIFIFIFNLLGANLRHSHVWLSWGKIGERFLISPAQHQLHHSRSAEHHNCNLGTCLSIWDLLANTHLSAPKKRPFKLKYGCKLIGIYQANSLKELYFNPFTHLFKPHDTAKKIIVKQKRGSLH